MATLTSGSPASRGGVRGDHGARDLFHRATARRPRERMLAGAASTGRGSAAVAKFGGIRIEDDLAVTRDGCENLTREAFGLTSAGIISY